MKIEKVFTATQIEDAVRKAIDEVQDQNKRLDREGETTIPYWMLKTTLDTGAILTGSSVMVNLGLGNRDEFYIQEDGKPSED